MKSLLKRFSMPAVCATLVLGMWMTRESSANRNLAPKAATVATVSLKPLLDQLNQRAAIDVRLQEMSDGMKTEHDQRIKSLENLMNQYKAATDDAARKGLEDRIGRERLEFEAWKKFVTDQMDVERALVLQDLYRAIKKAVDEIAKQQGYDLVVVNDATGEVEFDRRSKTPAELQVNQQISARQMLYAASQLDITSDIITKMNNEFKAGMTIR